MNKIHAFTLIELLIVVAIIAILAAIAVPNFLEAQTRAKVSRIRSDARSVATGVEMYMVDHNKYPAHYIDDPACESRPAPVPGCYGLNADQSLWRLTTPIAYLSSYEPARDTFSENRPITRGPGLPGAGITYDGDYMFYLNFQLFEDEMNPPAFDTWCIRSIGPDGTDDAACWRMRNFFVTPTSAFTQSQFLEGTYDPTNGTVSNGDITRFGGWVLPEAAAVQND
jgi:prepilin-type N-terminal cleavage/methylation domain-containing protein